MRLTPRIIAAAGALVLLAGAAAGTATYVAAQDGGDNGEPTKQERRDEFIGKVAENLNVTPEQLTQAFKDAAIESVDEAVADGKIDAERAAEIKERINSGEGFGFAPFGGPGHGKFRGPGGEGFGDFGRPGGDGPGKMRGLHHLKGNVIRSAAAAIGVEPRELMQALRDGKSIADVAGEHGVSLDAVKQRIAEEAKAKLDEAVAAGRIDQAKADEALQKLTDSLDETLNRKRGGDEG